MRVAVTGGTGFVGRHVVRLLLRRDHELRLLVREKGRLDWLGERADVALVEGDLENQAALRDLVHGVDAVIHLVGIITEQGRQSYERVHVQGTGHVLASALKEGVRKFVYMSALGARTDPGATAYHRTKAQAESLVKAGALPHVILRPSLIAAPGNEVLMMMLNMLRMSPIVPVIGNGLYKLQPIAADDAAEAFAIAVENSDLHGTFDIAGPDQLTYHGILDQLEQALGVRRRRVAVPVSVVRFSAYAGTVLPNLNPITPDQLQMLLEGNTTAQNAITSTFGITPRHFADVAREIAEPWAATAPAAPPLPH